LLAISAKGKISAKNTIASPVEKKGFFFRVITGFFIFEYVLSLRFPDQSFISYLHIQDNRKADYLLSSNIKKM